MLVIAPVLQRTCVPNEMGAGQGVAGCGGRLLWGLGSPLSGIRPSCSVGSRPARREPRVSCCECPVVLSRPGGE